MAENYIVQLVKVNDNFNPTFAQNLVDKICKGPSLLSVYKKCISRDIINTIMLHGFEQEIKLTSKTNRGSVRFDFNSNMRN